MEKKTNNARHFIDGVSVFCAFDEIVEIDKLKENPKNPNTHPPVQIDLLAQIIKKTGWRAPITVSNVSGFIVKGHGRLQAAKAAGFKHCPVEYQNFKDEEEELAALLADNKLAELAEIDVEKISEIFNNYEFQDLSLTGFSQEEVNQLVEAFEKADLLGDPDEVPEEVETRCKLGDIWQLGNHRLMCGDSTSRADVEKLMDGQKADMVFTDPPYGVDIKGKFTGNILNDDLKGKELEKFLELIKLNLDSFSNGHYYICYEVLNSVENFNAFGKPDEVICFNKDGASFNSKNKYNRKYELILFYLNDKELICKPEVNVWDAPRSSSFNNRDENGKKFNEVGNFCVQHPTTKPLIIPARAIKNSSKINDNVLDLFGGSGSTLIVCEQLNRKCYMMELDEHYCDVIITRWETLTGEKAQKVL